MENKKNFSESYDEEQICFKCEKELTENEIRSFCVPVTDLEMYDGQEKLYFCKNCHKEWVIKCEECGKSFYVEDEIPCDHLKFYDMVDIAYEQLKNEGKFKKISKIITKCNPDLIKRNSMKLLKNFKLEIEGKINNYYGKLNYLYDKNNKDNIKKNDAKEKNIKKKINYLKKSMENFDSNIQICQSILKAQVTKNENDINKIFDIFCVKDFVSSLESFHIQFKKGKKKYWFSIKDKYYILKVLDYYNSCTILKDLEKLKKKRDAHFGYFKELYDDYDVFNNGSMCKKKCGESITCNRCKKMYEVIKCSIDWLTVWYTNSIILYNSKDNLKEEDKRSDDFKQFKIALYFLTDFHYIENLSKFFELCFQDCEMKIINHQIRANYLDYIFHLSNSSNSSKPLESKKNSLDNFLHYRRMDNYHICKKKMDTFVKKLLKHNNVNEGDSHNNKTDYNTVKDKVFYMIEYCISIDFLCSLCKKYDEIM